MAVIVYLDEAGDHSLEREDEDFPVFVLVMFICDIEDYIKSIVPAAYQLKFDYFGHEGVVLHSRDIRKGQGDFTFLRDAQSRQPFYERINEIMGGENYKLIASVIRKQEHKARYGRNAENPYDLSLEFCMERLVRLLEGIGQSECEVIAESRGRSEDDELRLSFLTTITGGTSYVGAERFRQIKFQLTFLKKSMNVVGTQLADLAAYPIARYVIDKDKLHPSYDVIRRKIRDLKIFP